MKNKLFGGEDTPNQETETDTPETTTPETGDKDAKLKEQKKAAFLKMKARKDAALATLISLAQRMGDEEEKKAAEYLTPGHRTSSSGPKAPKIKKDMVAEIFGDSNTVHEDKIFMDFKLGRPDMAKLIKQAVNQNVWISFDAGNGIYSVVRGAQPEGWLGPQPKPAKVD